MKNYQMERQMNIELLVMIFIEYLISLLLLANLTKNLQISFWTINYVTDGLVPIGDFCKIIIGVMSDPSNKNTFVAVDTVEITSLREGFTPPYKSLIFFFNNARWLYHIGKLSSLRDGSHQLTTRYFEQGFFFWSYLHHGMKNIPLLSYLDKWWEKLYSSQFPNV